MAPSTTIEELFAGDGEMPARCRSLDWAATPLGPVEQWSPALRTIVRTALSAPFPLNLWCGSDLVLIYNDAYRHVLGSKHPRALGRPGYEVWSEIWGEIEPMFQRIAAGGPPAYAADAPFVIEREGPASTGEPRNGPNAWFTFSLSPVRDDDGRLVAFLNIVSESTGRVLAERATEQARAAAQQAEARLREVFAQAPAFLAVLRGQDHVFEYVNTAYYQLVGHRELVGRPLFEALPEVRGQGFEVLLNRVLETGEPFIGREVAVMITPEPGGSPLQRFVDLVYYPIREADGTCSGVVAHGSDVTDHVLARGEALRARADAEQANLAKSQFLANMSHEIRTPINAVMGYADLLDTGIAGPMSERQQEYVSRILSSSRHLLGLVDDVLDLAKVEAGELMVNIHEAAIEGILRAALDMVEPQVAARGLTLRRAADCAADTVALCDPARVRQIVLNLLSNAIKFTEPGGTIEVGCRLRGVADPHAALPDTGPWIVIDVQDNGAGIPDEHLGRIFDPFVQVEAGHTRRASGTGLGLTISRRFARLMGGDVTVQSAVGRGSCFSLWLAPASQEAVVPASAEWQRITDWPADPQELPGLGALGQILLAAAERVEDELLTRLRADPHLRSAQMLDRARLADHTAGVIAVMARSLTALDEGTAGGPLIEDGAELQRVMAVSHGRQRHRLGWGREELRREYQIMHDLLDSFLRRESPQHTTADIDVALGAVHRLLDKMERASIAAFDAAS